MTELRTAEGLSWKGPGATANEDTYGRVGATCWVIDGATGLQDGDGYFRGTKTDAAGFTTALSAGLAVTLRAASLLPLRDVLSRALDYAAEGASRRPEEGTPADSMPVASVVLVRVAEDAIEWLRLGDAEAWLPTGPLHVHDPFHRQCDDEVVRAGLLRANAEGREMEKSDWIGMAATHRRRLNTPEWFWAASLLPSCMEGIEEGTLPRPAHGSAWLWSDGFGRLVEGLGYPLESLEADGKPLRELAATVRRAEASPGSMGRWPRLKQHDDLTVLRISW